MCVGETERARDGVVKKKEGGRSDKGPFRDNTLKNGLIYFKVTSYKRSESERPN